MLQILQSTDDACLEPIQKEMEVRGTKELFLLFMMGCQHDILIKHHLEAIGVHCVPVDPATIREADVLKLNPKGIIISGGPDSAYTEELPFDKGIFNLEIPTLGICLGFQMWAKHVGARVEPTLEKELGPHTVRVIDKEPRLLKGCPQEFTAVQSHGDAILLTGSVAVFVTAVTEKAIAAGENSHLHGLQFHPEVSGTECGRRIFQNFCLDICGAKDLFVPKDIAKRKMIAIQKLVGDKKVLLALSGGSDSSTTAYLLKGCAVRGVYIKGVDRPDDEAHVRDHFGNQSWIELKIVDATERFLAVLKGIIGDHEKRVAVKKVYKGILEEEAALYGASFISQGTLYTDISESGKGFVSGARKAKIKEHHNVGLNFSLGEITPLDDMVKDTARAVGREAGVPEALLTRQPFPGPGTAIRVKGEVTREKLQIATEADRIFIGEIRKAGLYEKIWQAGVSVLNDTATLTQGSDSGRGYILILQAVESQNGFTAEPYHFDKEFVTNLARRLADEVRGIAHVGINIMPKPPCTIELG